MKSVSAFLLMVLASTLVGCGQEEPPAPPPKVEVGPRKIPTERVLRDFYRQSDANRSLPDDPNALMTEAAAQRLVKSVQDLLKTSQRAEEPEVVINSAAEALSDRIKEADTNKLWSFVPPLVEAYQILRPDDKIFQSYATRAQKQLTRPKVALRGLYTDHTSGMTTALLRVYDPMTRVTSTQTVRLGEEISGIKFTKVIGKDEGIELEIESTGTIFQVMKGGDLK